MSEQKPRIYKACELEYVSTNGVLQIDEFNPGIEVVRKSAYDQALTRLTEKHLEIGSILEKWNDERTSLQSQLTRAQELLDVARTYFKQIKLTGHSDHVKLRQMADEALAKIGQTK